MTGISQFAEWWNQPWKAWSHTPRLNGSAFSLASSQDGTYIAPGHKSWVKQVLKIFAFTDNPFTTQHFTAVCVCGCA